ncbi:MAG: hypothetical protein SPI59_03470 [Finegoldia sp.]|nr:hypothetical protein [Finegoldia sp.]
MRYLFFQDGKLGLFDKALIFIKDIGDRVGNIYIAKVSKYDKNLNAYFVNYEGNDFGFLNKTKYLGDLKPADEILLQMTKDKVGKKLPKFTSKISIRNKDLKYISKGRLTFEEGTSKADIKSFKKDFDFKTGYVYKCFFKKIKKKKYLRSKK